MTNSKGPIEALMAAMASHDVGLLETECLTLECFEAAVGEDDGPEGGENVPIRPRAVGGE